ncbi:MAG: hypothetical protein MUF18_09435 [Fimbriiglobus sp.]|nr:hypothetical protein [Fimbriiglobus sp.]
MIRQICLSCYKTVELADDAAGKDVPCPSCGKPIAVPAKYTAGVAEGGGLAPAGVAAPPATGPRPGATAMTDPAAPPGLKAETLPPPPPPLPADTGPTRGFGFALDPKWLDWVPAACLVLAFVLSFFPWAEMKPGGYAVMTQNGWEALFASKGDYTPKGDEWEKLDAGLAGKGDTDPYKDATLRSDWLLLPYLLLVWVLVLLSAAERVVRDPATFPLTAKLTFLPPLWKWRLVLLGGLAVLAFLLVWFQSLQGFSLQKSINNFAYHEYNKKLAEGPTDAQKRELGIRAGQTAGRYAVQQTGWVNLLLLAHAAAVVAMAGRFWLTSREGKPLPRLDVKW